MYRPLVLTRVEEMQSCTSLWALACLVFLETNLSYLTCITLNEHFPSPASSKSANLIHILSSSTPHSHPTDPTAAICCLLFLFCSKLATFCTPHTLGDPSHALLPFPGSVGISEAQKDCRNASKSWLTGDHASYMPMTERIKM